MELTGKEVTGEGLISSPTDSHKLSNKPQKNRRRVDLRVTLRGHKFRLQAYEDTPDGRLLLWLKSLPKRERDLRIMEALQVFYYPDALAWAREHDEEFKDITDDKNSAGWLVVAQSDNRSNGEH